MEFDNSAWNTDISFERRNTSNSVIGDRLPIPVTIPTLLINLSEAEDTYVLGNYNFTTVQTVGTVYLIEENEDGAAQYGIQDPDDAEKKFVVLQYPGENRPGFVDDMIVEGMRIRVIGKLKGFENVNTILAFSIQDMSDDKDYKIFKLEARAAQLFFEKDVIDKIRAGQLKNGTGMLAPPWTNTLIDRSAHNLFSPPKNRSGTKREYPTGEIEEVVIPHKQQATVVARVNNHKNYTGLKAKVYGHFKAQHRSGAFSEHDGIPFHVIHEKNPNMDMKSLQKVLDELIEDGSIFMTTDDHYWIINDDF